MKKKLIPLIYLCREQNLGVAAKYKRTVGKKSYEDIIGYINKEKTVILKIWDYDLPEEQKPNRGSRWEFVLIKNKEYRAEWIDELRY